LPSLLRDGFQGVAQVIFTQSRNDFIESGLYVKLSLPKPSSLLPTAYFFIAYFIAQWVSRGCPGYFYAKSQ
jgi:hypothetical protein